MTSKPFFVFCRPWFWTLGTDLAIIALHTEVEDQAIVELYRHSNTKVGGVAALMPRTVGQKAHIQAAPLLGTVPLSEQTVPHSPSLYWQPSWQRPFFLFLAAIFWADLRHTGGGRLMPISV